MKKKQFWLKAFNVRPDESWLVKRVFFLQFLQGAGLAFFFTGAFALFLSRFDITELPYVFIYSSLLLWMAGFFYARVERHFSTGKLAMIVTIFMAASMLFFRLAFEFIQTDWFLYWMLAWFNVLYLLNNLEFWGLAALLFNARQSKRLFSVISAGDIPAKFIGYTLALLVVEYIGTINLLWAGLACMLGSIPLLIQVKNSGFLAEHHGSQKKSHAKTVLIHDIPANILTRRLALLSIIVSACFIIINFSFYAGVKTTYDNEVGLAKFIAFFLALVRIIALVIKMILTSRLINRLGIINSLLVTPVLMLCMVLIVLVEQNINGGQRLTLYLFGITALSVDILRSSINSPVFLTIMQPLSIHERLRAHTIVKGLMDPFASLIAGVLLLLLIQYKGRVDLLWLCYVLLTGGLLWIVGIFQVNRQYRRTILQSISSRYFKLSNFHVTDTDTMNWLKAKLKDSSEQEGINILSLIRNKKHESSEQVILQALDHSSEKVIEAALKIAVQNDMHIPTATLESLLEKKLNSSISADCIMLICMNEKNCRLVDKYLNDDEISVRNAVSKAFLLYGEPGDVNKVQERVIDMLTSADTADRLNGIQFLENINMNDHLQLVHELMDDPHPEIRKAAYAVAARSGYPGYIHQLMARLQADEKNILHALMVAGNGTIKEVSKAIAANNTTLRLKEQLILLCGRIGNDEAQSLLIGLLKNRQHVKPVIKALYRSNYSAVEDKKFFEQIANELLAQAAQIVYMQNSLQKGGHYEIIINSFQLELNYTREALLSLFAIIYNRDDINKVKLAYAIGQKDAIINAMEIIDLTVRKDIAGYFNTIYEPGDVGHRVHQLKKLYPYEFFDKAAEVCSRILSDDSNRYNSWTTACSLYTTKKHRLNIRTDLIMKYISAEDKLLAETARFAL